MATIQSLGIGSGLLTSDLLDQLVEAERAPATARLDRDQDIAEARLSAFGEVSSMLATFNTSIKQLNSVSAFNASQAVSSNESVLTATASSVAADGNYNINVQKLAQQHTLATQSYASTTEAIGVGSLTFRFGTTEFDGASAYQSFTVNPAKQSRSITIDSSNNTLAGIRDAVNKAKIGVQATIVDDGTGFRLLFTSSDGGANNSLEITASGSASLDAFNYNLGSQDMQQTQLAQDAEFTVNGLAITRNSNLVGGVIPGVTLNLKGVSTGPATLSISKDPTELMDKVQGVVDSYNALKTMTDVLTAFNPDAGENGQGSVLTGDRGIRTIMSQVNSTLRSFTLGSTYGSLAEVGVTTNQFNEYMMEFDRSTFQDAFQADPKAITALFATTGIPSDENVSYVSASSATQPGSYSLEITRMAEAGRYQGIGVSALAAGNIDITDANNSFNIFVNNREVSIDLAEGTYATAELLAEELQRQINSSSDLIDSANSVTVTYNSDESRFEMTSNRFGSESVIRIIEVDSATAATLGLVKEGQGPYQGLELSSLTTSDGQSSSMFNTPLLVDSETQYSVTINGATTGVLTLPGDAGTPVTYNTPDELTAALKSQIDAALAGDGITVNVNYVYNSDDDTARLVFSTASAGDEISFSDINLASATRLGLFEGRGEPVTSIRGTDVAGLINGVEARGSGQVLVASTSKTPETAGYYLNTAHGDLSTSTSADKFRLRVDGVLSGEITLGVLANTSSTSVANTLQTAINNDPALIAAGKSVSVTYDNDTGGFRMTSGTRGTNSSVTISTLEGNAAAVFGFASGAGAAGQSGAAASGDADPASGLRIRITDGDVGDRGTVDYFRGVASRLTALIDSMLGSDGVLTGRSDSLNAELERIAEKRVDLAERLALTERRLQSSFLANDIIISNFNSTASFLESQLPMLEALVTPNRKK
ncbi:flagellar filament capping protein FliD [Pseudohongiella sp. O18]|uniref:flagellar filament capping protein FliD n=1 Tax=Pseudohongiella sp. O18 TaxID=2904248 RepID=UPI001F014B10|nr:flagellar filament capping protein FliD [Pseudohongiella sp. O18]